MFRLSEKLLHPFPEGEPETLPRSFFGFVWACTVGLRGYIVLLALQTIVKHQTLAINFPLRLRWNFHRMMLGQSLAFYSDEFAGRITTKVMQTALAWFALYAVAVWYFVPRLGRIVEEGTHRELLAQGGLYARLWSHQSGGFLGESEEKALAA